MKFSLGSLLGGMLRQESLVDPATFNDPVALETSWEPLKRGGTNFRTHKAVQTGANRVEFKATTLLRIFPLFFIIIPLIVVGAVLADKLGDGGALVFDGGMMAVVGVALVFAGVAYYLIHWARMAIVFDRNYGYYWKGKRDSPGQIINPAEQKEAVKFSEIHALQIISEWVSGNGKGSRPYRSYELNLVLKSGERRNVIDHRNVTKLREDAHVLSSFLDVPVWDRTSA